MKSVLWVCFFFFSEIVFAQTESGIGSFPFIRKDLNQIQFYDRSAVATFHQKWISSEERKISFVHLGDSHVQPDIFPGEVRKRLQEVKGKGGQGMMFPYSTAKTYSSVEYSSTHKGIWKASRSIELVPKFTLGVSGATARTEDPNASFTLSFNVPIPDDYSVLKLFFKHSKESFDFTVEAGGKKHIVYAEPAYGIDVPYVELKLPASPGSITIEMMKRNGFQNEFEFYGMSLESSTQKGLIYHGVGIGGARFNAVLHQKLLRSQLKQLAPDLVILDYGTNDFLYDDLIKPEFYSEICASIDTIRKADPGVCVLLTTTHDMYYHKRNVKSSSQFCSMIRKIAREKKCAYYDWFQISGGQGTMKDWQQAGVAQKDFVHLNTAGYRLKGKMFAEAFLGLMTRLSKNENELSFVLPLDSIKNKIDSILPDSLFPQKLEIKTVPGKLNPHKVRKGESLSIIARKYKISVTDLKKWNKLKTEKIQEGQILIVGK